MIKSISLVFLFMLSNNVFAGDNDGNVFLKYCSNISKSPEKLSEEEFGGVMYCLGAIHGIDAMQQVEKIKGLTSLYCPPPGYSGIQGASITLKYLQDNPQNLQMSGTSLMVKALIDAFPCK